LLDLVVVVLQLLWLLLVWELLLLLLRWRLRLLVVLHTVLILRAHF